MPVIDIDIPIFYRSENDYDCTRLTINITTEELLDEFLKKKFSKDFNVSEESAYKIIDNLDLYDKLIEFYYDEVQEYARNKYYENIENKSKGY